MKNDLIIISDERVKKMPVLDCGDPIVLLNNKVTDLHYGNSKIFVRRRVFNLLVEAQTRLPPHYKLCIIEGHRPLELQTEYFQNHLANIRSLNPHLDERDSYDEASKFVAPPDVAPHATGGAIDVTILDSDNRQIEMGTRVDDEPSRVEYATYTYANNISHEAKRNRKILVDAMEGAGFINYPTEWWHWYYGDKYWAFLTKQKNAIFDFTDPQPLHNKDLSTIGRARRRSH
ncbi:MAG: M15 family metallopeptidase [Opitutales bacterium]|nr:M15 family metallopeptidase [Opitutales bacterium]